MQAPMHQVYSALLPELRNWAGVRSASWANDVTAASTTRTSTTGATCRPASGPYVPSPIVDEDFHPRWTCRWPTGAGSPGAPGDDSRPW